MTLRFTPQVFRLPSQQYEATLREAEQLYRSFGCEVREYGSRTIPGLSDIDLRVGVPNTVDRRAAAVIRQLHKQLDPRIVQHGPQIYPLAHPELLEQAFAAPQAGRPTGRSDETDRTNARTLLFGAEGLLDVIRRLQLQHEHRHVTGREALTVINSLRYSITAIPAASPSLVAFDHRVTVLREHLLQSGTWDEHSRAEMHALYGEAPAAAERLVDEMLADAARSRWLRPMPPTTGRTARVGDYVVSAACAVLACDVVAETSAARVSELGRAASEVHAARRQLNTWMAGHGFHQPPMGARLFRRDARSRASGVLRRTVLAGTRRPRWLSPAAAERAL